MAIKIDMAQVNRALASPAVHREAEAASVVWARVKGYPFWPAQVLTAEASDVHLGHVSRKKGYDIPVMFFGSREMALVSDNDVASLGDGVRQNFINKGKATKTFQLALAEVCDFLSLEHVRVAPRGWWCEPLEPISRPTVLQQRAAMGPSSAAAAGGPPLPLKKRKIMDGDYGAPADAAGGGGGGGKKPKTESGRDAAYNGGSNGYHHGDRRGNGRSASGALDAVADAAAAILAAGDAPANGRPSRGLHGARAPKASGGVIVPPVRTVAAMIDMSADDAAAAAAAATPSTPGIVQVYADLAARPAAGSPSGRRGASGPEDWAPRRPEPAEPFAWPDPSFELPGPSGAEPFTLPKDWLLNRPPRYQPLRMNHWAARTRPKRMAKDEITVCSCDPHPDAPEGERPGCRDGCLNRLSYIHCDPRSCPAGDACSNRPFHLLKPPKIEAFPTADRGHGVRAGEAIRKGSFLVEYAGEVIDQAQLEQRMEEAQESGEPHFYIMELQPGLYIDARRKGNFARLLNSSCDPNCETQKWHDAATGEVRIGIFALRDIAKGEELCYDYFFEHYGLGTQAAAFRCMCGAKNCRGTMDVNPDRRRDYGRRLEVFWDGDKVYYRGTVVAYSSNTGKHTVLYDDGERERVCLEEVPHRWLDAEASHHSDPLHDEVPEEGEGGGGGKEVQSRGGGTRSGRAAKKEEEGGATEGSSDDDEDGSSDEPPSSSSPVRKPQRIVVPAGGPRATVPPGVLSGGNVEKVPASRMREASRAAAAAVAAAMAAPAAAGGFKRGSVAAAAAAAAATDAPADDADAVAAGSGAINNAAAGTDADADAADADAGQVAAAAAAGNEDAAVAALTGLPRHAAAVAGAAHQPRHFRGQLSPPNGKPSRHHHHANGHYHHYHRSSGMPGYARVRLSLPHAQPRSIYMHPQLKPEALLGFSLPQCTLPLFMPANGGSGGAAYKFGPGGAGNGKMSPRQQLARPGAPVGATAAGGSGGKAAAAAAPGFDALLPGMQGTQQQAIISLLLQSVQGASQKGRADGQQENSPGGGGGGGGGGGSTALAAAGGMPWLSSPLLAQIRPSDAASAQQLFIK